VTTLKISISSKKKKKTIFINAHVFLLLEMNY